ncbi:hypothetical protein CC80DRAFT_492891 [Byssothecium circinans]|uniref:Uncharacterized protein n=1 Tax=Byssothecium circinans TaxID=147558 RepID=A0A6A5TW79_9PLEO|nr:hypothetical protein CC80DRAFT_492891 [Byssothecium circinans]
MGAGMDGTGGEQACVKFTMMAGIASLGGFETVLVLCSLAWGGFRVEEELCASEMEEWKSALEIVCEGTSLRCG